MADILKITTPLINKSQPMDPKRPADVNTQFDIHNVNRVVKPATQEEILAQNNGLNQQEGTSEMLLSLLKDPSVAASSLKNLYLMQELIKLLPVNNETFTKEIQQLFDQMFVSQEEIAPEMLRQEQITTVFKGEMFDFLRGLLGKYPDQRDLRASVVSFLKALNQHGSRGAMLESVANSLEFLSESLASSHSISERLTRLAQRFRQPEAMQNFDNLKRGALALFKEVEDSILFSPKLAKVLSIATYNLSRYNDNPLFIQESTAMVLSQLRGEQARDQFVEYLNQYFSGGQQEDSAAALQKQAGAKSVMDVIARLLGRRPDSDELMLLNPEKVEKILRSLLSSPCNFTPLLHFVVPVQYEDIRSFAEIWINQNGEEDDRQNRGRGGKCLHMLLVFDISDIGRFEMELYVREKVIDLSLFCPPGYLQEYTAAQADLSQCLRGLDYRFGEIQFNRLERPRSLMDVFRSLPYRRTGVDVKV